MKSIQKHLSILAITAMLLIAVIPSATAICPFRRTVQSNYSVQEILQRLFVARWRNTDNNSAATDNSQPDSEKTATAEKADNKPVAETLVENTETDTAENTAPDYASQVLNLVNQHRAEYGLSPLVLDVNLCDKATVKSQDMADNHYFSHTSPTYGSPFDMMKQFGISYQYAGENIAMGYSSAEAVVTAWMNSEGHRANILSANFTKMGVGYAANGNYWTQWFIG